jgi:hypothetical protein
VLQRSITVLHNAQVLTFNAFKNGIVSRDCQVLINMSISQVKRCLVNLEKLVGSDLVHFFDQCGKSSVLDLARDEVYNGNCLADSDIWLSVPLSGAISFRALHGELSQLTDDLGWLPPSQWDLSSLTMYRSRVAEAEPEKTSTTNTTAPVLQSAQVSCNPERVPVSTLESSSESGCKPADKSRSVPARADTSASYFSFPRPRFRGEYPTSSQSCSSRHPFSKPEHACIPT